MKKTYHIISAKYFLLFIALCIVLGNGVYAQNADSIPVHTADTILKKNRPGIKLALDFDKRFSFINSSGVKIWGYRIGLSVKERYKVGIGGYFLSQQLSGIILDATGVPINQLTKNLYIGTIYYEPYLFRRKRWEMGMVFEVGYGSAELDSSNKVRGRFLTKIEKQDFVAAGMGYSVNFNLPDLKGLHFLSYFSLNGIVGLRKTVFNSNLQYNYDGWYWSAGVKVFIDKIFTDAFGNKKKIDAKN